MVGLKTIGVFIIGWGIAQVAKMVVWLVQRQGRASGKELLRVLMKSGGMPSGHAASLAAMTMYLGLAVGFDSVAFAMAVCFMAIVLYDAVNVRWVVGEHGKILARIVKGEKPLRVVEGHTVGQVAVGVGIGILTGMVAFLLIG